MIKHRVHYERLKICFLNSKQFMENPDFQDILNINS